MVREPPRCAWPHIPCCRRVVALHPELCRLEGILLLFMPSGSSESSHSCGGFGAPRGRIPARRPAGSPILAPSRRLQAGRLRPKLPVPSPPLRSTPRSCRDRPGSMQWKTLTVERNGAIARVWLDRPQCRNALNTNALEEIVEVFESFQADCSTRVVILGGRGPSFCAGAV